MNDGTNDGMSDPAEWLTCTREDMLAAERAQISGALWRGGRVRAFLRRMGLDGLWHAVLVRPDGRRLLLEEEGYWISPAHGM